MSIATVTNLTLRRAVNTGDPATVLTALEAVLDAAPNPEAVSEALAAFRGVFWLAVEDADLAGLAGVLDLRFEHA